MKISVARAVRLQPFRRTRFDFLNEIGGRARAGMRYEKMDMIRDRSGFQEKATEIFNDAAEVGMELVANRIGQDRMPVFRGKHQVNEDLGERLWHGGCALSGLETIRTIFPRALPWAIALRPFGASVRAPYHARAEERPQGRPSWPGLGSSPICDLAEKFSSLINRDHLNHLARLHPTNRPASKR